MIRKLVKLFIALTAAFFVVYMIMAALCGNAMAAVILVIISVGGAFFNGGI